MSSDGFKVDEKSREEIEKALQEYERQVGLNELKRMDPPEYLSMSIEDLRKKTPDELSEATYLLAQYSLYLQRVINKEKAWDRWGTSKLNEITAHNLPSVGQTYGFNQQELLARNSTDLCKSLNAFLRGVKMKIDRLSDIPNHVKQISDAIKDIKFAILRKEKIDG